MSALFFLHFSKCVIIISDSIVYYLTALHEFFRYLSISLEFSVTTTSTVYSDFPGSNPKNGPDIVLSVNFS